MTSTSDASSRSVLSGYDDASTTVSPSASGTVSTTAGCGRTTRTWSRPRRSARAPGSIGRSRWKCLASPDWRGRDDGAHSTTRRSAGIRRAALAADARVARSCAPSGAASTSCRGRPISRIPLPRSNALLRIAACSGVAAGTRSHRAASARTRRAHPRPSFSAPSSSSRPTLAHRDAVPGLDDHLVPSPLQAAQTDRAADNEVAGPDGRLVPVGAAAHDGAGTPGRDRSAALHRPHGVEAAAAGLQLVVHRAGVVAVPPRPVRVDEHLLEQRLAQVFAGAGPQARPAGPPALGGLQLVGNRDADHVTHLGQAGAAGAIGGLHRHGVQRVRGQPDPAQAARRPRPRRRVKSSQVPGASGRRPPAVGMASTGIVAANSSPVRTTGTT